MDLYLHVRNLYRCHHDLLAVFDESLAQLHFSMIDSHGCRITRLARGGGDAEHPGNTASNRRGPRRQNLAP